MKVLDDAFAFDASVSYARSETRGKLLLFNLAFLKMREELAALRLSPRPMQTKSSDIYGVQRCLLMFFSVLISLPLSIYGHRNIPNVT